MIWISRDEESDKIDMWVGKPSFMGGIYRNSVDVQWIGKFCNEIFARVTNIKLKKGKLRKVKKIRFEFDE